MTGASELYGRVYKSRLWRNGLGVVVLVNAVVLGAMAEVTEGTETEYWLGFADQALLMVMVIDAALCIAVRRRAVLKRGWDLFDIGVTFISVIPDFGMLSAFRVVRVIRVMRLISFIPNSRAMVDAMVAALRDMAAAFVVLAVVFYSFVVITTSIFRDLDAAHYGTLGRSAAHLYGIMVSLGSNLGDETVLADHLWALPFFGVFIIVASFGLMNMFIAVLVSALREELEKDTIREERERFNRLEQKLEALTALVEGLATPARSATGNNNIPGAQAKPAGKTGAEQSQPVPDLVARTRD